MVQLNYWNDLWEEEYELKYQEIAETLRKMKNNEELDAYQEIQSQWLADADVRNTIVKAEQNEQSDIEIVKSGSWKVTIDSRGKNQTQLHREYQEKQSKLRERYCHKELTLEEYNSLFNQLFFMYAAFIKKAPKEELAFDPKEASTTAIEELKRGNESMKRTILEFEKRRDKYKQEYDQKKAIYRNSKLGMLDHCKAKVELLELELKIHDMETGIKSKRNYSRYLETMIYRGTWQIPSELLSFKCSQLKLANQIFNIEEDYKRATIEEEILEQKMHIESLSNNGGTREKMQELKSAHSELMENMDDIAEYMEETKRSYIVNKIFRRAALSFITIAERTAQREVLTNQINIDTVYKGASK